VTALAHCDCHGVTGARGRCQRPSVATDRTVIAFYVPQNRRRALARLAVAGLGDPESGLLDAWLAARMHACRTVRVHPWCYLRMTEGRQARHRLWLWTFEPMLARLDEFRRERKQSPAAAAR